MQSRLISALEKLVDISVGFIGSLALLHWLITPFYFHAEAAAQTSLAITLIYTAWSFLRGYGTRRLFNRYHHVLEAWAERLLRLALRDVLIPRATAWLRAQLRRLAP
ncbi:MAG TPA: hypothetical protein VNR18_02010 [Hyphomicrobiales bacterium]|nr:hypothetical protein [Hyphomicrobiales bacterium]